jgi:hypothetical protein
MNSMEVSLCNIANKIVSYALFSQQISHLNCRTRMRKFVTRHERAIEEKFKDHKIKSIFFQLNTKYKKYLKSGNEWNSYAIQLKEHLSNDCLKFFIRFESNRNNIVHSCEYWEIFFILPKTLEAHNRLNNNVCLLCHYQSSSASI